MTGPREGAEVRSKPTLWQRMAVRKLRRAAGRAAGEPLAPEDWEVAWRLHEHGLGGVVAAIFRALPSSPRCGICGAPFAGPGRWIVGPLGYRPSRKNPTVCGTCVEFSPPGGMTQYIGVLFADLRGFTAQFDGGNPEEASRLLRRFYRCAEDVLFPDAVIDKLIGDEVMALYPAVGDVVNTASRLQAQAAGGEVVLSQRVADGLRVPVGTRVELQIKGKRDPQIVYRLTV